MSEPTERPQILIVIGRIIAILGIVWMALSGLCGATVLLPGIFNLGGNNSFENVLGLIIMVVAVSGMSTLIGFGIWAIGRAISGK